MTIVTHVQLKEKAGPDWDTAMRTRLAAARKRAGWVGGQLLRSVDKPDTRTIVGTWRTRGDWEEWHHDPRFAATREELDGLERARAEHWWHDVVVDARKAAGTSTQNAKASNKRTKNKTKTPRSRAA